MGVLACNRANCENIMCDNMIDNQYICNECLDEFENHVVFDVTPTTEKGWLSVFNGFMKTEKTSDTFDEMNMREFLEKNNRKLR